MSVYRAESRRITPFDALLVLGIVVLAVMLITGSVARAGGPGAEAIVEVNGHEVMRVPLANDAEYEVQGFAGPSHFSVEGGEIYMVDSTCPDKLCIDMGWISRSDTSIVCLPNRVVIRVAGKGDIDTVNR
jgi:hypothetical protein